ALALPGLTWTKPAGVPARASVAVRLAETASIERLEVEGGGLDIAGAATFDGAGQLATVAIERFFIPDMADLSAAASLSGEILRVDLSGAKLDADLLDPRTSSGDGTTDIEAAVDLGELVLVPEVVLIPAHGRLAIGADGTLSSIFEGRVNGFAAVSGSASVPSDGTPGEVIIESEDAGAFLRATGLATEAQGGRLRIAARLLDGSLDQLSGQVRMTDVQMTDSSVLSRALRRGDSERQIIETRDGGLRFSEMVIPFRYIDGIVTMRDAVAVGPKLALRMDGRIDPGTGRVTMRGVASPAYALSSVIDRIPVLGRLLTGDRGEGLLALTFRVSGTYEDPEIDVNPLSILAPGILRSVFEGEIEDFSAGKDVVDTPGPEAPALDRAERFRPRD
ncbi:MAG: AsmA-like C-terminal region-containing protein, partial [Pseudomonadota bacterium]